MRFLAIFSFGFFPAVADVAIAFFIFPGLTWLLFFVPGMSRLFFCPYYFSTLTCERIFPFGVVFVIFGHFLTLSVIFPVGVGPFRLPFFMPIPI